MGEGERNYPIDEKIANVDEREPKKEGRRSTKKRGERFQILGKLHWTEENDSRIQPRRRAR